MPDHIQNILAEFEESDLAKYHPVTKTAWEITVEDFKYLLTSTYTAGVKDTEKAFGGCTNCYGKGYHTVLEHISGGGDFDGDPEYFEELPHMRLCTCERGKALKKEMGAVHTAGFEAGLEAAELQSDPSSN